MTFDFVFYDSPENFVPAQCHLSYAVLCIYGQVILPRWAMGTLPYLFSLSRCSIVTELQLTYICMPFGSFILRTFTAWSADLILGELCTWLCKRTLNGLTLSSYFHTGSTHFSLSHFHRLHIRDPICFRDHRCYLSKWLNSPLWSKVLSPLTIRYIA